MGLPPIPFHSHSLLHTLKATDNSSKINRCNVKMKKDWMRFCLIKKTATPLKHCAITANHSCLLKSSVKLFKNKAIILGQYLVILKCIQTQVILLDTLI